MLSSLKGRYFSNELFLDALKDKYVRDVQIEMNDVGSMFAITMRIGTEKEKKQSVYCGS